jgi:hypothetical protein
VLSGQGCSVLGLPVRHTSRHHNARRAKGVERHQIITCARKRHRVRTRARQARRLQQQTAPPHLARPLAPLPALRGLKYLLCNNIQRLECIESLVMRHTSDLPPRGA